MNAKPLVVDMDGALLRTDTLYEGFAAGLFRRPFATALSLLWLALGRARFKRRVARLGALDVDTLPLREDFVAHLRAERDRGRSVHLVTAADESIAERVAARVGVFDTVQGTTPAGNLKGRRKLAALAKRFPEGFAYAGDSWADMRVWRGADSIILAGAAPPIARRARALGKPVEAEFVGGGSAARTWPRALRVHQWSKNILVFAPLLLSHSYADPHAVLQALIGFFVLSTATSGTYLLNDLADLAADRRHSTKRARPLAAGDIHVMNGFGAGLGLIALAGALAFIVSPGFALTLAIYLAGTLSYTLGLKRIVLVDAVVLACLYAVRLAMGAVLIGVAISPWLISFALAFFFSLSLAKRHTELVAAAGAVDALPGRGYSARHAPVTLGLGAGAAVAAILILVAYKVEEAFPSGAYSTPEWIWGGVVCAGLWTVRIWRLAARGRLRDDPVAFAITDRASWVLGILTAFSFVFATVL